MYLNSKLWLFVLAVFICAGIAFAQTSDDLSQEPSFRLSDAEDGALFLQRLSWEKAQFAIRYLVFLEKKNVVTGVWVEALRRGVSADSTFTDVSVTAGEYRYRVASFNILDQLDNQTPWREFTVIQALQPSIVSFSPTAFYFDRLTPRMITITGENLLPETEIYLINKDTRDDNDEPLVLKPRELHRNELGETARLIFDEDMLLIGKYEIYAKNPGGLETKTGDFTIAIAKPFDINISGGYSPMLTLFGQKEYFLDDIFFPASAFARLSFVPFKWRFGNLGLELTPSWSYISTGSGNLNSSAHLVLAHGGALFQYWLIPKELSVNGRLGFGVAAIFNYHFEYNDTGKKSDAMNTVAFSYKLGTSIQWLFYRQIFAEASVDFVHAIHSEIPMGFIRFGISGGYQF